jgi:hypothetical protein
MAKRDRRQLANRLAVFVRKYARKANPGFDPNDRTYDREIEKIIRKMKPEDLDRYLRDGQ